MELKQEMIFGLEWEGNFDKCASPEQIEQIEKTLQVKLPEGLVSILKKGDQLLPERGGEEVGIYVAVPEGDDYDDRFIEISYFYPVEEIIAIGNSFSKDIVDRFQISVGTVIPFATWSDGSICLHYKDSDVIEPEIWVFDIDCFEPDEVDYGFFFLMESFEKMIEELTTEKD